MTPQEIFTTVATHLLDPNSVRSVDPLEECMYRGPNGTRCAVGLLIPDEDYHPEMEGNGIDGLLKYFSGLLPDFFSTNVNLLRSLQVVHDNQYNWTPDRIRMRNKLVEIAVFYNLEMLS